MSTQIRNIAIIAHVDHGKTTMVDQLLRQSGTFAEHEKVVDTVMDNNAIERERGITILAKNCAVSWKGTHINIVDTPGHADFGGEVERALSMVDGVVLLIDAQEGPMPQTRFVTKKALALGLKPIVVVNKVDKPGAKPDAVINAAFDLFDKLGATDEQLDFPVVYASGINGWSSLEEGEPGAQWGPDMSALFETILKHVEPHQGNPDAPLQLQISALDYSSFVGRIGVGRISAGTIKPAMDVLVMEGPDGKPLLLLNRVGQGRVALLLSDHAWLWARGFEGGGPQAELLRRLAHWLMKEPGLEEERLSAEISGGMRKRVGLARGFAGWEVLVGVGVFVGVGVGVAVGIGVGVGATYGIDVTCSRLISLTVTPVSALSTITLTTMLPSVAYAAGDRRTVAEMGVPATRLTVAGVSRPSTRTRWSSGLPVACQKVRLTW